MASKKRTGLRRLASFGFFACFMLVGYVFFNTAMTKPVPIPCSGLTQGVQALVDVVPESSIPEGFSAPGSFSVQCENGVILMRAQLDASVLGKDVAADMIAIGEPRQYGNGFWATLIEQLFDTRVDKRVVYHFYDFQIDPETFMIDGEPAIETAVPGGQKAVEYAAEETGLGRLVTGGLDALGFDTSDERRDAWTAETMRTLQVPLINMFSQYVENNINGKTLYEFGDNALENFFVTVFKGFEIADGNLILVFTVANLFLIGMLAVIGTIFGIGWWVTTTFIFAREQGMIDISDETAEKIGSAIDIAKDL